MDAERIDHLIVLRAHRLRDEQRMQLLQLRWLTGVRLVLVWHTRTVHADWDLDLVGLPHEVTTDLAGLLDELAAQPRLPGGPNSADDGDLPAVPHSDFDSFRADAARTLAPATFLRVDGVYTAALHQVCRYLADREWADPDNHSHPFTEVWSGRADPVLAKARGHDIDTTLFGGIEPDDASRYPLQAMLAGFVADSPSPRCTITRVRGAQAALQLHGWRLELPNLAFSVGPGLTTTPLMTVVVDRPRTSTQRTPRRGAGHRTVHRRGARRTGDVVPRPPQPGRNTSHHRPPRPHLRGTPDRSATVTSRPHPDHAQQPGPQRSAHRRHQPRGPHTAHLRRRLRDPVARLPPLRQHLDRQHQSRSRRDCPGFD
ncbi:hypothetical protein ABIA39_009028 [Nocardia sp. GAS34]|uniref:hypothetical protein n=1 Tax=unclassified Nocardia TaxID=2637762 RepID=UPI003D1B9579